MTLYGLDIIRDQEQKLNLIEVNGVASGMSGFRKLYGDNRVEKQVDEMLDEKYGRVMHVSDFSLYRQQTKDSSQNVIKSLLQVISKSMVNTRDEIALKRIINSEKSYSAWLDEAKKDQARSFESPIISRIHLDQECYVRGYYEVATLLPYLQKTGAKLINNLVEESITENKFFQYRLLKDEVAGVIPSTLVGLGTVHEKELKQMLHQNNKFVIKPILGNCGNGVKKISKANAMDYIQQSGTIDHFTILDELASLFLPEYQLETIQEDVKRNNFCFEYGLAVIQPQITSHLYPQFSHVRAIVCNGQFVDAYESVGPRLTTNRSKGTTQVRGVNHTDLPKYAEMVVKSLEDACNDLELSNYKSKLYTEYFDEIGPQRINTNKLSSLF